MPASYLVDMCPERQKSVPCVEIGVGLWLVFCTELQFLAHRSLILDFNSEVVLRGLLEVLKQAHFPLPHTLHGGCQLPGVSSPAAGFVENLGKC